LIARLFAPPGAGGRFALPVGMARPLRVHIPGMQYHVVSRGNEKGCIFVDDQDCESFMELLRAGLTRFGVSCISYCLLWNHFHLLLAVGQHSVSRLMQHVNSKYAQEFNRRHGRVGHLYQGRFGSRMVDHGAYTRAVLRYVALNPVAARRVEDPADWKWSSYRATVGLDAPPTFLALDNVWAAFGTKDAGIGRSRFAQFVLGGLQDVFTNPLLYGADRLARHVAPLLTPHRSICDYIAAERFAVRPSLGALFEGQFDQGQLEGTAHVAFVEHAYTLAEIAAMVNRSPSTVCRWIHRVAARSAARSAVADNGGASIEKDTAAKFKI
jgi:putative transposase